MPGGGGGPGAASCLGKEGWGGRWGPCATRPRSAQRLSSSAQHQGTPGPEPVAAMVPYPGSQGIQGWEKQSQESSPLPWGGRGAEPADLTHKCTQCASSPERFSRSAAPTAGSTPIGTSPEHKACAPGVCMSVCVCVCVHNGRASPSWQQPRGLGDRCLLESGARVRQAPAPSPPCARRWLCSEWSCQGGLHSPAG